MSKVRINDLSRELEVKSRFILEALPQVGVIEKKTHSSSVEAEEADRLRKYFYARGVPQPSIRNQEATEAWIASPREEESIAQPEQARYWVSPAAQNSARTPLPPIPRPRVIMPQTETRPGYSAPQIPSRPPSQSSVLPSVQVPSPTSNGATHAHRQPLTREMGSELLFMRDEKLRQIAIRDYAELQQVARVGALKSRFILMGAVLEAMLLDALLPRSKDAGTTRAASKERDKKLDHWRLASLIDAAVELDFVKPGVKNFSHQVRDFRNLIHPAFEKRMRYDVRKAEADILEQVLKLVMQDLRDRSGVL